MKKAIVLSSMILALLASALLFGQSSPETTSRIRDKTSPTTQANVSAMGATQPATNSGLNTVSGTYYYHGGSWLRWPGAPATAGWSFIPDASTASPLISNLNYGYDLSNGQWMPDSVWTIVDGMSTSAKSHLDASLGMFFNNAAGATSLYRLTGEPIDSSIAATAPAAPFVGAYNVYWNSAAIARWAGETWDTSIDIANAPATLSLGTFHDNVSNKGYWLNGEPLDAVLLATEPVAPYVGAVGVYFNDDDNRMDRSRGQLWTSDMLGTHNQPNVNAFGVFYNDSTVKTSAWHGEAWDTSMDFSLGAPAVLAADSFYDTTSTKGYRWTGSILSSETTANTTAAPHTKNMLHAYDAGAATWRWINVIDTQADAQASTLNGLVTSSIGYGYNGTTFDMLRVGASNELQTTDIATRPGEDAGNDWRKIKTESIATYTPAFEDTAAFSALTTILASTEIVGYTNVCLYVLNSAGGTAAALSDALVQISPDNSNFVTLSWTDCDTLAANATCVYCIDHNAYRYVRLRAQTAGATTTTRTWLTANKG